MNTTSQSTLTLSPLAQLKHLRWLVAYLGSKRGFAWWDCSFMDETGVRFLSTTFPRTAMGAAFEATVEASQKHHDAALGKNGCYHLFRLPLHIEQRMHEEELARTSLPTKEEAMDTLASYAESQIQAPDGPVQIGVEKRILKEASIQELAAHYHSAFSRGIRSYPYFSADT